MAGHVTTCGGVTGHVATCVGVAGHVATCVGVAGHVATCGRCGRSCDHMWGVWQVM